MTASGTEIGDIPGLTVSLTLLCVVAVLLNIVVITVLSTKLQSYTSVDLFIINLCVSDILMAGIALPVRLNNASHSGESFKGGNPVCKMVMFIPLMTVSSSIFTMVAISVDRLREIVKNQKLMPRTAISVISGIWISGILVSSPQLYEYKVYMKYEDEYNITSCGAHDILENFETIYASTVIVLSYAVPLIIIMISYTRVVIFVWKAGKSIAGAEGQILRKRVKIVRLLIAITVVFALLWSPYFVLFGIEEIMGFDDTLHTASWTHVTKTVMAVLSTMSNPVIYFTSDSKFRRDLLRLLTGASAIRSTRLLTDQHQGNTLERSYKNHFCEVLFRLVNSGSEEEVQNVKVSERLTKRSDGNSSHWLLDI